MYCYVWVNTCVPHVCEGKKSVGSPRTIVSEGFELLDVGVGDWTQVSEKAATALILLAISPTTVTLYISHICNTMLH